ncbi:MAG: MFS transporter, partial [Allosphingosinicella sp.]
MTAALPGPCDGGVAASCRAGKTGAGGGPTLVASILASSLAFVDGSVVNVALPAIGADLGAEASGLQWIVNAYLLPLSALLLLGGAAGDKFGRRRLFLLGIALFALASALCALAPNLPLLLAGRALQGVASAMLMPNSLALLGAAFGGEARGRAIGTWAAAGAIAGALGPLLGGWLVESVGWRSIFLINLPVAAGALWLGWRHVAESREEVRAPL